MLTSDVLMLSKIFNYPIERVLANMNIGILWNLLCDCLVCHGNKSVFVPKWAVACFPDQSTGITKLTAAA